MPGFSTVSQYVAAQSLGRYHCASFRKVPSQASTAVWWVDLSMAGGNPVAQYYASSPLEAAVLDGSRGIYHGQDKSPYKKYLAEIMLQTPTAGLVGNYMLCDYLLYYPFINLGDTDPQAFVNNVSLPRYQDGNGVMAIMVATTPTIGGGSFSMTYIDSYGVERTSPTQYCATAAGYISNVVTSQPATVAGGVPFLLLNAGSVGIRRIINLTMSLVDDGLAAIVLVKPIANVTIREVNTPAEVSMINLRPGLPEIADGAYLGFFMQCAATVAAGALNGWAKFVWA